MSLIFVRKIIEDITNLTPGHLYCQTIKILCKPMTFCYIPPRFLNRDAIYTEMQFGFNLKALMFGDFNSKLASLQLSSDRNGRQLETIYMNNCYQCINTPNVSTKPNSDNVIDLLLVHQSCAVSVSPLNVFNNIHTTSDHFAVHFSVSLLQDFLVPRKIRFHVLGRNDELTNQFQQQLDICIQSHDYTNYSTDQK